MSRHEMNNTLIARGPGFKSGARLQSPTGNVDLAPTVLRLLGLAVPDHMEGRVLTEALSDGNASVEWSSTTYRAERSTSAGMYCQTVTVSTVGETAYIDEGSGWLMS
jgi:arylsulfatase A-like enzyme